MKAHGKTRRHRGFTLIELMVGLTIGLLTVLIITEVFAVSNIRNRQIAGGNDAQQAATIVNYQIGNILRQAGSNLLQGSNVWGCRLQAKKGTDTLVSRASWPASFSSLDGKNLRVTPIAVMAADDDPASRGSDIVVAMGGSGGTSYVFSGTPDTVDNKINVPNSNGVLLSDYFLMASTDSTAVGSVCYLLRASSSSTDFPLTNTGGMLDDTPTAIPLDEDVMPDSLANITVAIPGNIGLLNLGTTPKFYMLGVDPNQMVLTLYDLLQDRNNGTVGSAITLGENVFMLRVLYGADNGTGGLDWHSPNEDGWQFDDLQAGTPAATTRLRTIKALRLALIARATYPSSDLSPATIKLFSSLSGAGLEQTISLTPAEQRYRYQVYETVVPLFNI